MASRGGVARFELGMIWFEGLIPPFIWVEMIEQWEDCEVRQDGTKRILREKSGFAVQAKKLRYNAGFVNRAAR